MAWMNQAKKAVIAAAVKPILQKYGMKGSLSVRNGTAITLTLTSGPIDFVGDMLETRNWGYLVSSVDRDKLRERYVLDINQYWYHEHYSGKTKKFIEELIPAMKAANWYDRSDITTDYFDTAYYFNIHVGKWNKPYTVTTI